MKRRKLIRASTAHTSKGAHLATKHTVAHGIVARLAEQAARAETEEKLLGAKQRRRLSNVSSKQPPLSDEMKSVTEIGSLLWKLGTTN